MLTIKKHQNTASEEDIERIEKKYSIKLPQSYRKFLLTYNGGELSAAMYINKQAKNMYKGDGYSIFPNKGIETDILNFLEFHNETDNDNIEYIADTYFGEHIENHDDNNPENLIYFPIAWANDGIVVLSLNKDDYGYIYLQDWQNNDEFDQILLNKNFKDFVVTLNTDNDLNISPEEEIESRRPLLEDQPEIFEAFIREIYEEAKEQEGEYIELKIED